jgi:hypothetical protein
MNHRLFFISTFLFSFGTFAQQPVPTPAQEMDHTAHMAQAPGTVVQPKEPGQSSFAAIQEIVALLEADATTDWSKVNIAALHRHLVDMNNVTLYTNVTSESVDNGVRYNVTGSAAVSDSIRRMVMGHAKTMSGVGGWQFMAKELPTGVTLTVTVGNKDDLTKLRALSFIGVMTRGMHHQSHHLSIARGHGPHE